MRRPRSAGLCRRLLNGHPTIAGQSGMMLMTIRLTHSCLRTLLASSVGRCTGSTCLARTTRPSATSCRAACPWLSGRTALAHLRCTRGRRVPYPGWGRSYAAFGKTERLAGQSLEDCCSRMLGRPPTWMCSKGSTRALLSGRRSSRTARAHLTTCTSRLRRPSPAGSSDSRVVPIRRSPRTATCCCAHRIATGSDTTSCGRPMTHRRLLSSRPRPHIGVRSLPSRRRFEGRRRKLAIAPGGSVCYGRHRRSAAMSRSFPPLSRSVRARCSCSQATLELPSRSTMTVMLRSISTRTASCGWTVRTTPNCDLSRRGGCRPERACKPAAALLTGRMRGCI
mmetsp:Transcript_3379/g.7763  ORF Transcript_3379/g.7763 Transcript_3379/m.7763 type:complete len:337 (+) Transcript_3379:193-1203(+)